MSAPAASASGASPSAVRVLAGLLAALLLGALLFVGLDLALTRTLTDNDELWHLATGRAIVASGAVPDRDPFTFTAGDTRWTNTNWLAQEVLWRLYARGGLELCWLLGVALLVGATTLSLHRARGRGLVSPWALVPVPFYVLRVLGTGSTVRPQGWSFLLLAAALLFLDRLRARGRARDAVGLGLTLALAAQLHGGFVFAFAAVAITLAGESWDALRRVQGWRVPALAGLALALGLAGFLVHPHGLDALAHPIRYAADPRLREMFESVAELRPAPFDTPIGALIELPLLALLALAVLARPALATSDVLLVLAFAHVAFQSARGVHYLAPVVAVPLAVAFDGGLAAARRDGPPFVSRLLAALADLDAGARAFVRLAPFALAAVFAVTLAARWSRLSPGSAGDLSSPLLVSHASLIETTRFLEARNPPGNAWNEMEMGGLLLWRLGPRRKVFMDGRGDLHALAGRGESSTWHEHQVVRNAREGWEAVLDRHAIDVALVSWPIDRRDSLTGAIHYKRQPLDEALREKGWRVAFESSLGKAGVTVFARPGSASERALLGGTPR